MSVDVISALVRALSFIALFQAAGVAITLALAGARLEQSAASVRRVGFRAALIGLPLVGLHYALEAGRMAGTLAGVVDVGLQQIVLDSSMSTATGVRLLGLALIAGVMQRQGAIPAFMGLVGALCITIAFTFVGHTADESKTPWLAVLLTLHLIVVAFWFGGLIPLDIIARRERAERAAEIVARFTRVATIVVPGVFVAGVLMTLLLVERWEVFAEPYGLLLIAKASGFGVLMALAALNKWRYGPAIAGGGSSVGRFRRAVAAEYAIICIVLAVTAVMTTFFSPQ